LEKSSVVHSGRERFPIASLSLWNWVVNTRKAETKNMDKDQFVLLADSYNNCESNKSGALMEEESI
jgi:hypothetical protein